MFSKVSNLCWELFYLLGAETIIMNFERIAFNVCSSCKVDDLNVKMKNVKVCSSRKVDDHNVKMVGNLRKFSDKLRGKCKVLGLV